MPGQTVTIGHKFSKAVADSYKHSIKLKINPGREIIMDTVAVAGKDPNIVTYGLSIDFKMDGWENILR